MAPPLRHAQSVLLALLLLVLPTTALAGWPNDPSVNVPLCTAPGLQQSTGGCPDGQGGTIFCWKDDRTGTSDIYAQRVDASGRRLWGTFGMAVCTATGSQYLPAIASDGAGGAYIVWTDGRSGSDDIYIQRLDASGKNAWTDNGVALCTATSSQRYPSIVTDATGGAIVAWEDYRSGTSMDVYAQRIARSGAVQWTANGVAVCTAAENQNGARAIADATGGGIVVWHDYRAGNWDIYAQRIMAGGSVAWAANGVAVCATTESQQAGAARSDGAGGIVVTWYDNRSGNYDIYAQRMDGSGVAQWTAGGVAVCTAAGTQQYPRVAGDGAGGAIVAWEDLRSSGHDIYAQRVSATGSMLWTGNGVVVCGAADLQQSLHVIPDGTGGVVLTWEDRRSGADALYAQRLNASGGAQWTANGVALCATGTVSISEALTSDDAGGAVCAWTDSRGTDTDLYMQHVDQWGRLGAQPTIASVRDVANDEGGQVKVSWYASPLDSFPEYSIGTYNVYRSVPASLVAQARRSGITVATADAPRRPSAPGDLLARTTGAATTFWEYVAGVTARRLPGYSCLAPTECDSLPGSNPKTLFMVEARSSSGTQWWFSDPDSGYSVDDLAPATPTPFTGTYAAGTAYLQWGASAAPDFAEFRLYRGHGPDFVPGPADLVATLTSLGYVDPAGAPFYYKLSAVDVHGNTSPFATLLPAGTTDAPGPTLPRELALSPPAPNPLRGSCSMRLALPRAAEVSLAVFDQQGRRVRTLLAGGQPAGEHAVIWDGRDDGGRLAPSGIYFVRAAVEGRAFTHRLTALR